MTFTRFGISAKNMSPKNEEISVLSRSRRSEHGTSLEFAVQSVGSGDQSDKWNRVRLWGSQKSLEPRAQQEIDVVPFQRKALPTSRRVLCHFQFWFSLFSSCVVKCMLSIAILHFPLLLFVCHSPTLKIHSFPQYFWVKEFVDGFAEYCAKILPDWHKWVCQSSSHIPNTRNHVLHFTFCVLCRSFVSATATSE